MKKSIFYLAAFLAAVSCTEKEDYDGNVPLSKGVEPTEFVHLSDGEAKAGEVIFQSN